MKNRYFHWVVIGGLLVTLVLAFYFVYSRGHVVLNRYTDATWHIAVADEYARTGVFGKDPFIPDAPPFAQFGLWDFVNGLLIRWTGVRGETIFILTNAVFLVLSLVACFLAGVLSTGHWMSGLLALILIPAVTFCGDVSLIRGGWPFAFASSLYFMLLSLASRFLLLLSRESAHSAHTPNHRLFGYAAWMGLLIGVIFSLHAFVGLFAGIHLLFVAVPLLFIWWSRKWLLLSVACCAGGGFLIVAWPWVRMHLEVHQMLRYTNEHLYEIAVRSPDIVVILGSLIAVFYVFAALRGGLDRRYTPLIYVMGVGTLMTAIGLIPSVNRVIAETTSSFMAMRIHYFVPSGLLIASMALSQSGLSGNMRRWRGISISLFVSYALLCVAPLYREAKVEYYLGTTRDYDVHEYDDMLVLRKLDLSGKIVLSDPFTSYYARRHLGCYAITVPAGHASPAVDYGVRDAIWVAVLQDPDETIRSGLPFDYILINKRPRKAGGRIDPGRLEIGMRLWHDYGQLVYEDNAYALFRVPSKVDVSL